MITVTTADTRERVGKVQQTTQESGKVDMESEFIMHFEFPLFFTDANTKAEGERERGRG